MEEENNNDKESRKMKKFKIFNEVELDEIKSTMYGIVKGNQEKGKVVFKGSKRTALKKLRANEFGPNTILINSPSAKVGDKWGKGKVEEVEIDESTKEYAKSLEKIANDRALKMLTKSERENLKKIAALLDRERKAKEDRG